MQNQEHNDLTIVKFSDPKTEELTINLVGGKGSSLIQLFTAGLPVPDGFIVTTNVGKESSLQLQTSIMAAFDSLGADRVAVRSSAVAEDSQEASWAGQFESYLNVTRDKLIESITRCQQSALSIAVNEYAERKSIEKDQLKLAVVIQKMVESEVSGVAFSVNPITKNTDEVMIEAIYGFGELLVQGMITPDNYLVRKDSSEILDKKVAHKANMMIYESGKNTEKAVSESQADEPCLSDEQIVELSNLVARVEKHYASPQDIEWALENGRFYIVQARPVTTL